VQIGGVRIVFQFGGGRNPIVVCGLGRRRFLGVAEFLRFGQSLFRPGAGGHIGGFFAGRQKIHRNHRKLEAGATLQEQYFVVLRNRQQLFQQSDRVVVDRFVFLAAMAHFQQGHARATEIQQIGLGFFQRGQWQGRRAGIEIVRSVCRRHVDHSYFAFFGVNKNLPSQIRDER